MGRLEMDLQKVGQTFQFAISIISHLPEGSGMTSAWYFINLQK
jgi:hypothetical protein